jgi:hypothetical protein
MSTAVAPSRSFSDARTRAQALAIGSSSVNPSLQNLFARSHWTLVSEASVATAVARLSQERFPAVFCNAAEWQKTLEAVSTLQNPPIVIALSGHRADDEWLQAITKDVYVLDANHLAAPEIFSLLNHAWRVCNQTGL